MRNALIAVLALAAVPARADEARRFATLEAGTLVLGSASGDHPAVPNVGVRGGYRWSEHLAFALGYAIAPRSESAGAVAYDLKLHRLYARADVSFGRPDRQFYLGLGPALFLESSHVSDPMSSQSGLVTTGGVVVAAGLRLDIRWAVAAFEFGAEQRGSREDFLVTALFGARF
jgi:hypothetical protein